MGGGHQAFTALAVLIVAEAANSSCPHAATADLWSNSFVAARGGSNVSFSVFAGKVGLGVNVASF